MPTHHRKKSRNSSQRKNNLAGEHAFTDIGQVILLGIFLAVWITDSFVFHYSDIAAGYVPLYVRLPIALAVLVIAAVLGLKAHAAVFGGTAEDYKLLTDGVFRTVRNPMYLGGWLFFVGLMIATLSMASAAVCLVILLFYLGVSRAEERLLEEKFGSEYRDYRERVPRFFPLESGRKRNDG